MNKDYNNTNKPNEQIFKGLPPQNIEAEQSVLGCLIIDKEAIIKVADFLEPEDFYKTSHQKIYNAILDLYNKHEPMILSASLIN
jgi:replicative DNA helicase